MFFTGMRHFPSLAAFGLLLAPFALVAPASANPAWTGIACRSVHLGYQHEPATALYNEARVVESATGSYFMAQGWAGGYFGMQELTNGKKVVIFSVWDSDTTDNPNAVAHEQRTKLIYKDAAVRTGRFGGEGTGGQSFFDYEWKKGESYRFIVHARPMEGGRTEFSGFFYLPESKSWKHLVTFSTPTKHKALSGGYSFVEDFKRNRKSCQETRRAEFGPVFARDAAGGWAPVTTARFTADGNKAVNIDAGPAGDHYFLATGGPIENTTVKLWSKIAAPAKASEGKIPADADRVIADFVKNGVPPMPVEAPVAKPAAPAPVVTKPVVK